MDVGVPGLIEYTAERSACLAPMAEGLLDAGVLTLAHLRGRHSLEVDMHTALQQWADQLTRNVPGLFWNSCKLCLAEDADANGLVVETVPADDGCQKLGALSLVHEKSNDTVVVWNMGETIERIEAAHPGIGQRLWHAIDLAYHASVIGWNVNDTLGCVSSRHWGGEMDEKWQIEALRDEFNHSRDQEIIAAGGDPGAGAKATRQRAARKAKRRQGPRPRKRAKSLMEVFAQETGIKREPWSDEEIIAEHHILTRADWDKHFPHPWIYHHHLRDTAALTSVEGEYAEIVARGIALEQELARLDRLYPAGKKGRSLNDNLRVEGLSEATSPIVFQWYSGDPTLEEYDERMNEIFNAGAEDNTHACATMLFNPLDPRSVLDAMRRMQDTFSLLKIAGELLVRVGQEHGKDSAVVLQRTHISV